MTKQNKRKTPLVFRVSLVLVCALLCTMHLTGGLYARYVASASASDDARVATFKVNETVKFKDEAITLGTYDLNVSINPGESLIYTFSVKNESEVSVRYRFIATNVTQNLPLTFAIVENDTDVSADGGVAIAMDSSKDVLFKIGWSNEDARYNSTYFCGKSDYITVTVIAEQID